MTNITITAEPRQTCSAIVEGHDISIELFEFRGIMYADVSLDGTLVVQGMKCIHDQWLTGARNTFESQGLGNLKFVCEDGESYPYYTEFGTSCFLQYFSADEI